MLWLPARSSRTAACFCLFVGLLAASAVSLSAPPKQEPGEPAWVIVGAQILDGSGGPAFTANLRVVGDRIQAIGELQPAEDDRVIRAEGKLLAPGFIDIHNHSAEGLEQEPLAVSQISQGITTIVLGPDGDSPWPIADFLAKQRHSPPATNLAVLVGHETVRRKVMGEDFRRPARPQEVQQMAGLVEQAMREGAAGLSSGLEYEVGSYSTTPELVELARVAARYGGFYMTHIRDEADRTLEALSEALEIGRRARVPVEISHIKLGTVGVWGKAAEAVALIEQAHRRGQDVTADCYPYAAWASTITVLVPSKRHDDPASVAKALADVGGAQNITIVGSETNPEYEFRTLEEIATDKGITPVELYREIVREGGARVIGHSMSEADVRSFYQQPWVMVASDGGVGMRHPRAAGSFPRVLGRYVREEGWLTLPEAIRKMTALPARRLQLKDRGLLREGMKADLVLFDPAIVIDRSTFADPHALSVGIEKVFVNGVLVWNGAGATGARPGRVLSR